MTVGLLGVDLEQVVDVAEPGGPDGLAEMRGRVEVARAGEGGEHAQFDVGEQQFGRQLGHLAAETEHQLDAPAHDHVDGDGAFEAFGGVVL